MQAAIITRYHGPTNFKSGRVKATARQRTEKFPALALTQQYEHGLSTARNHADAARRLAERLGWAGVWVAGGLPDERGNVFVNIGTRAHFFPSATEGADWFSVECE